MIDFFEDSPLRQPLIFDTHAHYDDSRFDGVRDTLLSGLPEHGICGVITCGCDGASSKAALNLCEKYDYAYAAVGIHPENLKSGTEISEIEKLAAHEKCVAIGEIGLDYYWEKDNKKQQQECFIEQILLANRLGLPVIVHDRDAHSDVLSILKAYRPRGVVHCFSGSVDTAREIIDLGMYIGVGGVITFKNAKRLPEVVRTIPQDRLLLETDCPYLSPEPYRGRLCHSGMIYLTAQKIAEIRGTNLNNILEVSANNAKNLFL